MLELISPAGLERFFRWLAELDDEPTPRARREGGPYQCDVDLEATAALMQRLGG